MGKEKFRDDYESFCQDPQEFLAELHERQDNTKIYDVSAKEILFYAGSLDGSELVLSRLEDESVIKRRLSLTDNSRDVLCDDECLRIGLYAQIINLKGGGTITEPVCLEKN